MAALATGCPHNNVCTSCYLDFANVTTTEATTTTPVVLQLSTEYERHQQSKISITLWDETGVSATTTYSVSPEPCKEPCISPAIPTAPTGMNTYTLKDLRLPTGTPTRAWIEIVFTSGLSAGGDLPLPPLP
jgi:hypothetical protein